MKLRTLPLMAVFVGIVTLTFSGVASAHVVVKPSETVTAGYQTFTVGVPNEKDIPTTSVELRIPEGLSSVQPTLKAGWDIAIETEGEGDAETVTSITWSGNTIGEGFRDEFTFSGKVPESETELQWKAYQTYSDGTVVAWDKESAGDGHGAMEENRGPLSVTGVVAETAAATELADAQQAATDAEASARIALYVGVAGVLAGLAGIFVATRKTS